MQGTASPKRVPRVRRFQLFGKSRACFQGGLAENCGQAVCIENVG